MCIRDSRYHLYANIGTLGEIGAAAASGAEGIGLFRTEFLFMDRSSLPTEEEQFDVYSEVSEQMRGKEVIIRTLDIGGDKDIPYMQMEKEENPFLGNRAIRYCLEPVSYTHLYVQLFGRSEQGLHNGPDDLAGGVLRHL